MTSNDTAEQQLSILVEHYDASFAITQGRERVRDRMLWFVVSMSVILTLITFADMFSATESPRGGLAWIAYSLQISGLQFVVWTLILVATFRHMQFASRVEADYTYIHALEKHLDEKISWTFCRERVGYVSEFPLPDSRKGYSFLYKILVPAFVVAQTTAAVINGWMQTPLALTIDSFEEVTSLVAVLVWAITTYFLLTPAIETLFKALFSEKHRNP